MELRGTFRLSPVYPSGLSLSSVCPRSKNLSQFAVQFASWTVWQIWADLEPYIFQLLLGAIALFGLVRDWEDYVKRIGRPKTLLLFMATITVIGLTLFETHNTRRETREKEQIAASKDRSKHEADCSVD